MNSRLRGQCWRKYDIWKFILTWTYETGCGQVQQLYSRVLFTHVEKKNKHLSADKSQGVCIPWQHVHVGPFTGVLAVMTHQENIWSGAVTNGIVTKNSFGDCIGYKTTTTTKKTIIQTERLQHTFPVIRQILGLQLLNENGEAAHTILKTTQFAGEFLIINLLTWINVW